MSYVLQVCRFLGLEHNPLLERLYQSALPLSLALLDSSAALPARKRPRSSFGAKNLTTVASKSAAKTQEVLLARPDVAEVVLSGPWARKGRTLLTLLQLHDALPAEMHAAATRGYFGAEATEWLLTRDEDSGTRSSRRAAQLLVQQPRVTTARLEGRAAEDVQLLSWLARAQHLKAIEVNVEGAWLRPIAWSAPLAPLSGLQRLEVRMLLGRSLPELVATVTQLRELVVLVLEGEDFESNVADEDGGVTPDSLHCDDEGFAKFAPALAELTVLERLGLPGLRFMSLGAAALAAVLPGLARLSDLDLRKSGVYMCSDALADALTACTSLSRLNLGSCGLREEDSGVRALAGMRAQLHNLEFDSNFRLGCAGVKQMLAAPALVKSGGIEHAVGWRRSALGGWRTCVAVAGGVCADRAADSAPGREQNG